MNQEFEVLYRSHGLYVKVRLIAASVPQVGGTPSTFLFEARLNVNEMNNQLSPLLEQTQYSAAYLYAMMPESVYEWANETGWEKFLR